MGARLDEALLRRVIETPERICAVDQDGAAITFRALWDASSSLAARLEEGRVAQGLSACGVGVLADTSVGGLIAYIACLQARVAYVPLDALAPPSLLEAQAAACLESVCLCTLVCDRSSASPAERLAAATELPLIRLNSLGWEHGTSSAGVKRPAAFPVSSTNSRGADTNDTAHVIFTSGTSSGRPRAVLTDHTASLLSHAWRWPLGSPAAHGAQDLASADDSAAFGDGTKGVVVGCGIFGLWDATAALLAGDGPPPAAPPPPFRE